MVGAGFVMAAENDRGAPSVKTWHPWPDNDSPEGWPTEYVAAADYDAEVERRERAEADRDRLLAEKREWEWALTALAPAQDELNVALARTREAEAEADRWSRRWARAGLGTPEYVAESAGVTAQMREEIERLRDALGEAIDALGWIGDDDQPAHSNVDMAWRARSVVDYCRVALYGEAA